MEKNILKLKNIIYIFLIVIIIFTSCASFDGSNQNTSNVQFKHVLLENETIAVLPFENSGLESYECEALVLFFENSLIKNNHNYNILERDQIDKVLKNHKLSYSDSIDEIDSNEIGNLLEAYYLVLGNLGFIDNEYYISVKLIEAKTGFSVGTAKYSTITIDFLVDHIDDVVLELFGQSIIKNIDSEERQGPTEQRGIKTWIKYALKGNHVYDKDDYVSSYMYYTYAIRKGCFDGLVWYRYAYSFEQLYGLSDIAISNYREALLLLQTQYTDSQYYQYAKHKIETYKG